MSTAPEVMDELDRVRELLESRIKELEREVSVLSDEVRSLRGDVQDIERKLP